MMITQKFCLLLQCTDKLEEKSQRHARRCRFFDLQGSHPESREGGKEQFEAGVRTSRSGPPCEAKRGSSCRSFGPLRKVQRSFSNQHSTVRLTFRQSS
jgi:hypothetical protein